MSWQDPMAEATCSSPFIKKTQKQKKKNTKNHTLTHTCRHRTRELRATGLQDSRTTGLYDTGLWTLGSGWGDRMATAAAAIVEST